MVFKMTLVCMYMHTKVINYRILQVWFAGEKIGAATGRTRKEAQQQAAEKSLLNLAGKEYCCIIFPTLVGAFFILLINQLVD